MAKLGRCTEQTCCRAAVDRAFWVGEPPVLNWVMLARGIARGPRSAYAKSRSISRIGGHGVMVCVDPRTEPIAHAEVNGYFGVEASMGLEPP
jgi:hypothetical protein